MAEKNQLRLLLHVIMDFCAYPSKTATLWRQCFGLFTINAYALDAQERNGICVAFGAPLLNTLSSIIRQEIP